MRASVQQQPRFACTRRSRVMTTRVTASAQSPTAGPADVPPAAQAKDVSAIHVKLGSPLPVEKSAWMLKNDQPAEVSLGDMIRGKKVVMFGLPGAYTSVCSSKHVPEYFSKREELKQAGVEDVICLSVNDPFVMNKWGEDLKLEQGAIKMLGDSDASLHEAWGLVQTIPGLGERARRYSMFVDDGVVKVLNIEEPGGMSYKVSGPSHMLADLANLKK